MVNLSDLIKMVGFYDRILQLTIYLQKRFIQNSRLSCIQVTNNFYEEQKINMSCRKKLALHTFDYNNNNLKNTA